MSKIFVAPSKGTYQLEDGLSIVFEAPKNPHNGESGGIAFAEVDSPELEQALSRHPSFKRGEIYEGDDQIRRYYEATRVLESAPTFGVGIATTGTTSLGNPNDSIISKPIPPVVPSPALGSQDEPVPLAAPQKVEVVEQQLAPKVETLDPLEIARRAASANK